MPLEKAEDRAEENGKHDPDKTPSSGTKGNRGMTLKGVIKSGA